MRTRRIRGTIRELEEQARELRWHPTPAEALLWEHLQARRLAGFKFRRQHPLGRFILDFCCLKERLVIEVDGDIHRHGTARDEARDAHLRAHGYRVLRFSNEQVLEHVESVIEMIRAALPPPR